MERYNAKLTEKKWQEEWEKEKTYFTDVDRNKEKYYVLEMFPIPLEKSIWVMFVITLWET